MPTTPISSPESAKKSNVSNSFKQFINCLNGSFNINIGKVIFQNSINLVGWPIISVSGGPLVDQLLNNYQYKFTLNNPIQ